MSKLIVLFLLFLITAFSSCTVMTTIPKSYPVRSSVEPRSAERTQYVTATYRTPEDIL